ncbi:RNA polymerase sigma-70 factor [Spirosoma koreense]
MQQKGIVRVLPTTDPASFLPVDDPADRPLVTDSELFIRRTFETDVRLGCELLFRQYYGPLCSHAVRMLGSKAIAEDLVADVFCRFYAEQTFQTITTSYRAYLYKTVRNRAFNYLRDTLQRETDLDEAQSQSAAETLQPDAITHYEELYQDVERAIQSLPVQRRRIYLMHRFEGKKYDEIASELQLAPKTVEVQVRKASHQLRDLLRAKWTLFIATLLTLLV